MQSLCAEASNVTRITPANRCERKRIVALLPAVAAAGRKSIMMAR
jgi:hypothetical protein